MKRMLLIIAAAVSVGMLFGCNDEEAKDTKEASAEVTQSEDITAEPETETTTQAPPEVLPTYENADNFDNTRYGWYFMSNGDHERPGMPNEHNIDFEKYYTYGMGSADEKVIYLTFDEGYENGYTEQILDTLKEKNVPAAFFVTGYFLDQRPDLVKRMVDEGHIVGSHSVNHYSSPELSKEEFDSEILDLENSFKEKIGTDMPHYFRPPRGEYSERTLALANNLG
ncbi:MAG: polysaccharide deacetylase family protein [Firmicutes bacterium]|nr:polysaccharide deacetylase family protein [Bacillota bacterium]